MLRKIRKRQSSQPSLSREHSYAGPGSRELEESREKGKRGDRRAENRELGVGTGGERKRALTEDRERGTERGQG